MVECDVFFPVSVNPDEEPGAATAHVNNVNVTSPGKIFPLIKFNLYRL